VATIIPLEINSQVMQTKIFATRLKMQVNYFKSLYWIFSSLEIMNISHFKMSAFFKIPQNRLELIL